MVTGWHLGDRRTDRHECFNLRRYVQATAVARPIERLDAEWIAGEIRSAARAMHDRERVLAAQPMERRLTPGQERLQDDFGVALGPQWSADRKEVRSQLAMVEDLAVVAEEPFAVRG